MDLQQLMDGSKDALRQRDERRKRTIRRCRHQAAGAIAAKKEAETEVDAPGERVSLDGDDILALISKQAKQRQESQITTVGAENRKAGRKDLAAEEGTELAILQAYLPQQLTRNLRYPAEARSKPVRWSNRWGDSSPRDMDKVMRSFKVRFCGRPDGRLASQVIAGPLDRENLLAE